MIGPNDADIIRLSAWIVRRECPEHSATTREDMIQEGWLAALEAQAAGRVPPHGPHREAYLRQRVCGAMRDARRRAVRAIPDGVDHEWPDADTGHAQEMIDRVYVREQVAMFDRSPAATPLMRETLARLLNGETLSQIARRRWGTKSTLERVTDQIDWLMAMLR